MEKLKVGLLGVGLDTYWPQFAGLRSSLENHLSEIANRIESQKVDITNLGLIDSVPAAREAAERLMGVDLLVIGVTTYALSSTILPVVRHLRVPVLLLVVQPTAAVNYVEFNQLRDRQLMTGKWLAYAQACPVPEFACVFTRAGVRFKIIAGYLQDLSLWEEVGDWLEAAWVRKSMQGSILGVLGHYYCGMLDVYSDLTQQSVTFGCEIKLLEMCEVAAYRRSVADEEIAAKRRQFEAEMDVSSECDDGELDRAARTAVAMDKLVRQHKLSALSYYYEGCAGNEYENIITSVIAGNTLLTNNHIPVVGECEVKTTQAMKVMDLFGAGGSFSEFYGMDYNEEIVLLGHDGPAHGGIAEGKIKLVPLPVYHGKPGQGVSIQMSVAQGPVTLFSIGQNAHGLFFLTAEGEAVSGETFQIGNTNSRYKFPLGCKQFLEHWAVHGPPHHMAIGVGRIASKIEKLAWFYQLPYHQIC